MTKRPTSKRLDQVLVERGLVRSRAAARDLIKRGEVCVAGLDRTKPSSPIGDEVAIEVNRVAAGRVSRGGDKLAAALDGFGIAVAGLNCLDLGASTGGFTQELLARGAASVHAVDIGHDQLAPELAADPRVVVLEGVDARALGHSDGPQPVDLIVADVSFISLTLALSGALGLARPGGYLLALVKPQFELEPQALGKGGVVRDEAGRARALAKVTAWLGDQDGWRVRGQIASPIAGGGGNREFFLLAQSDR